MHVLSRSSRGRSISALVCLLTQLCSFQCQFGEARVPLKVHRGADRELGHAYATGTVRVSQSTESLQVDVEALQQVRWLMEPVFCRV